MTIAPRQRIATVRGTFAKPGVSKNRRLYTAAHIADAVTEAQALIDSGDAPTVYSMMTHHGARDPRMGDVARTAGRVTKVALSPEGYGTFEAELADTQAGRDVAALVTPEQPYLKGVSMASVWKGEPRTVRGADGQPVETADGFSLKGIDFTHNPGITGAEVSSAELAEAAPAGFVYESIEEGVHVEIAPPEAPAPVTEANAGPYGDVTYADPGYQDDKKKRYPLDTAKHVRAAWAYINQADNQKPYSATQVKRIKAKIKKAAGKFDIDIAEELRLLGTEILEAYASVCFDNGPGTVNVSAYGIEPSQIAQAGATVAAAALAALYRLDPDCDGDIDALVDEDDDNDMGAECASCHETAPSGALFCPSCGQAMPMGESAPEQEEGNVPTTTETPGAPTETAPVTMTQEQLDAAIAAGAKAALEAAGVKPTEEPEESAELIAARKLVTEADAAKTGTAAGETAPAPTTTETAPVTPAAPAAPAGSVTITEEKLKELLGEATTSALDAVRKEIQEAGPQRRGFVPKSILEESTEALYGSDDETELSKLSIVDLSKLADTVVAPLL